MNRFLTAMLVLVAVAWGGMPAKAVTLTYSTSGSNAEVFLTPTSTGDIGFPPNSTFNLTEVLDFGDTSHGHYGQAYTYIPFTVTKSGFITATVNDLSLTDSNAKPLEWLSLALFEYSDPTKYTKCSTANSLCTLDQYDADPPTVSISAALAAGTKYLLKVGFGLCGCTDQYGGIKLTVATTPIPPAMLLFLSALLGMGGVAWRRRTVGAIA
jgi:hypothetical protein